MRFGLSLFIWIDQLDRVSYLIEKACRLGYDLVEIPLLNILSKDVGVIRHSLRRTGLECVGCVVLPREGDLTSSEDSIRLNGIRILKRCIDILATLDGDFLTGVTYAAWGKTKSLTPLEDWTRSVSALKEVCRYAAKLGVRIGIEPINRYRTYLVNTAEDALKMINDIGEENIGVHLDTYHMNIEEDDFRNPIILTGKKLYYFHCSENNRGILGTGHIDWDSIFQALVEIGYNDCLTLETYTPSLRAIAWKRTIPSPDEIALKSLEFLKAMVKKYFRG